MDDHLHDPWSTMFSFPCSLGYLTIVLTDGRETKGIVYLRVRNKIIEFPHRIRLGGLGVLPMYVLGYTISLVSLMSSFSLTLLIWVF